MDSILLNSDAHVASGSEDKGLVFIWDFVRSNEPLLSLDHSPHGPVWGALGDGSKAVDKLVAEAAKSSNFFIHSLSAHPTQSKLMTAGGDFVWIWDAQPEHVNDTEIGC